MFPVNRELEIQAAKLEDMRQRLKFSRPDVEWEKLTADAAKAAQGSIDTSFFGMVDALFKIAMQSPPSPR